MLSAPALRLLPGLRQHALGRVDPGHLAVRDQPRQVRRDRTGPAPHVEHPRVRPQPGSRYPAEFSAVRHRCDRSTLS